MWSLPSPHRGFAPAVSLCLAALFAGEGLVAQTPPHDRRGERPADARHGWELGAFSGVMDDRPEFEAEGSVRIAHEGVVGGRLGRLFASGLFLESEVLYAPMELGFRGVAGTERPQLDALFLTGAAGYRFVHGGGAELFLRAGSGGVAWKASPDDEVDFVFDGGGGLRLYLSDHVAVRGDGRLHVVPSALATTRRQVVPDPDAVGKVLWLPSVSAGLSVILGGG